jgi:hypothetical protein
MEPNEESYQSLQNDWRQEIQDMFNELKEKEQVKWFSVNFIESKYKILLGNS